MKEYDRTEGSVASRFKNDRLFTFKFVVYRGMNIG